jgi:hypothetical protein
MKSKLVIVVEGGNIQQIFSNNPNTEIVVVDYDMGEVGEDPAFRYSIDNVFQDGEAYQLFNEPYPMDREIRDYLKSIKL